VQQFSLFVWLRLVGFGGCVRLDGSGIGVVMRMN